MLNTAVGLSEGYACANLLPSIMATLRGKSMLRKLYMASERAHGYIQLTKCSHLFNCMEFCIYNGYSNSAEEHKKIIYVFQFNEMTQVANFVFINITISRNLIFDLLVINRVNFNKIFPKMFI